MKHIVMAAALVAASCGAAHAESSAVQALGQIATDAASQAVEKSVAGAAARAGFVTFSDNDRRMISDYYRQSSRDSGPDAGRYRDGVRDRDMDRDWDRRSRMEDGDGDRDRKHSGGKKSGAKGKSDDLPPGLAKRDSLPPGLSRKLEKDGTLPPGIAKRSLPSTLESRLHALPAGYERREIGADIVLVETASGKILDIIHDVVAGGARR